MSIFFMSSLFIFYYTQVKIVFFHISLILSDIKLIDWYVFFQSYRHIDNVTFENTKIVEKFLNYWRASGHQRIGYLYGSYEVHNDVPLGKSL